MKNSLSKRIIGIIGAGNMGAAILSRAIKAKDGDKRFSAKNFIITEKDKLVATFIKKTYRVKIALDVKDLALKSDIIIIAVKPQDMDVVLREIKYAVTTQNKKWFLIISIAAGINTSYIEGKISSDVRVIRAMPNMPVSIGKGITALCRGSLASAKDLNIAKKIFAVLGSTVEIKKENLINTVTAVSGSGPAYLFYIVSAMLAISKSLGMDRKTANMLIYHTLIGSADLLNKHNFDADTLISKVASKGGTTEAALKVFNERQLRLIIIDAIHAAYQRSEELSR